MLTEHAARIRTTSQIAEAVQQSAISFVIVPTPSEDSGEFSTKFVESACSAIGEALAEKDDFHVVALVSTVLPGNSRERIIAALERSSGKKCGIDFGYAYNPSFIALGSIIKDTLYPDMHLIGESDTKTGDILQAFYEHADNNSAPMQRMSIESAEITKIALNSYVTMKITFANMLADFAHQVPRANVDDVTRALGADSRIGKKYLKAGMGYGGPCFPRDNRALSSAMQRFGVQQDITAAVDTYNERMIDIVWDKAVSALPQNSSVAILGVSYKPDTPHTDEAQGLKMLHALQKRGTNIIVYDPPPSADPSKLADVVVVASIAEALDRDDACFISYLSEGFNTLPELLSHRVKPITVIDPWRAYPSLSTLPHVTYIPLGIGPRD